MGIRGLTTYINNRSHLYLETYELHNTSLVIDGNGLASHLYKWHCKANDCFTGDYDKYAQVVQHFFALLKDCQVTSYVIFDGGYECKKLATVASRMKNKIQTADKLNASTEGSESVFPLFLRDVFVDVVMELGIKCARCEFEGDTEIANIAKALSCPVLSYDSDFYIYGCLYIPFNTVELNIRKGKNRIAESYWYLPCKIYKVQKFLDSFGGLDQNNLPILAVLLGNDYVKGSTFAPFFRNLKIQKCHGIQSDQQKRIKSVIVWLQNETLESAIKTVLGRFKSDKRKFVMKKIQKAMSGYFCVNTDLLEFLGINQYQSLTNKQDLDLNAIEESLSKITVIDCSENENSDDEVQSNLNVDSGNNSENHDNESENTEEGNLNSENLVEEPQAEIINNSNKISKYSQTFLKNFRICLYPSCFMDIIMLNKYYCIPQCEETTSNYSHEISLDLLSIIHKILLNNEHKLWVIARHKKSIKSFTLPYCEKYVPSLQDISRIDELARRTYLLSFLNIDSTIQKSVSAFPREMHLFLYGIKYALTKSKFDLPFIYSLILCFLILNYVDTKIGFFRSTKAFEKKYLTKVQDFSKNPSLTPKLKDENFDLSVSECIIFMNKMVSFFQMDYKLRMNFRLYDKNLVHAMAQFQSCFLHIKHLNCLLNLPYPNLMMHTIFDGTFVYNMTLNLRKRNDFKSYIDTFLKVCPNIFEALEKIIDIVGKFCQTLDVVGIKKVKRKKKRRQIVESENNENCDARIDSSSDDSIDPNNFFSILTVI